MSEHGPYLGTVQSSMTAEEVEQRQRRLEAFLSGLTGEQRNTLNEGLGGDFISFLKALFSLGKMEEVNGLMTPSTPNASPRSAQRPHTQNP